MLGLRGVKRNEVIGENPDSRVLFPEVRSSDFFSGEKSPDGEFVFSKWNILSKIPCFSKKQSPESYRIGEGFATLLATGYSSQRFLK